MRYSLLAFLVALAIFFPKNTQAAIVSVDLDQEINLNVLGITNLALKTVSSKIEEVNLYEDNGKIVMNVGNGDRTSEMDLSGYEEEIIEIEKAREPERVSILADGSGFLIRQRGISAKTVYPLKFKSKEEEITVETESGERFVAVLPYEAVTQIIRSNIISDMEEGGRVELVEREEGELAYKINGKKEISLFRFLNIPVDVSAYVSALTGKVLEIEEPVWSRVLSFFAV